MDYVIDKKVIEAAKGYTKYTADLLMPFTSNFTGDKVVKNDKILDEYRSSADECIRTWMDLMTHLNWWTHIECDEDPIFIKTCKKTFDRKIIVSNKSVDYIDYEGVTPIDKDEAIARLGSRTFFAGNQIIQRDGGNVTTGANSPIARQED